MTASTRHDIPRLDGARLPGLDMNRTRLDMTRRALPSTQIITVAAPAKAGRRHPGRTAGLLPRSTARSRQSTLLVRAAISVQHRSSLWHGHVRRDRQHNWKTSVPHSHVPHSLGGETASPHECDCGALYQIVQAALLATLCKFSLRCCSQYARNASANVRLLPTAYQTMGCS